MSTTFYLDSDKTAPLEPWEGDERNGSWISPTEVPRTIALDGDPELSDIRGIRFDYTSGETGDTWEPLDDRDNPPVTIRPGGDTRKILEMTFGHPIAIDDLPGIAERLERRVPGFRKLVTTFNYQMIAAIFQNWSTVADRIE